MNKILVIKANPKSDEESITFKILNAFLEAYKKANPDDVITTLDLYKENLKPLDNSMLKHCSERIKYAKQFTEFDKYVVAAPMWNLSIPAILKMYIDYISIDGITFQLSETGSVGLLNDKLRKVLHIVTRGGGYGSAPFSDFEMGDRYLKAIFEFYGITNFKTFELEMTEVLPNEQLEIAISVAKNRVAELAKKY